MSCVVDPTEKTYEQLKELHACDNLGYEAKPTEDFPHHTFCKVKAVENGISVPCRLTADAPHELLSQLCYDPDYQGPLYTEQAGNHYILRDRRSE